MTEAETSLVVAVLALLGVIVNALYTHFATSKVEQQRVHGELRLKAYERAAESIVEATTTAGAAFMALSH